MTSRVQHFDDVNSLANHVSSYKGVTIIKASASWCGPCKKFAPLYDRLSLEFPNIIFIHVDVDQIDMKDVTALPTFIFIKAGKEVGRIVGPKLESIIDMLKSF